jgi:hypothetical protein
MSDTELAKILRARHSWIGRYHCAQLAGLDSPGHGLAGGRKDTD